MTTVSELFDGDPFEDDDGRLADEDATVEQATENIRRMMAYLAIVTERFDRLTEAEKMSLPPGVLRVLAPRGGGATPGLR